MVDKQITEVYQLGTKKVQYDTNALTRPSASMGPNIKSIDSAEEDHVNNA